MATSRAQIIEEAWTEGGLHGTLAKPADHVRGPAVLIVAGSGPTDRNGNGTRRQSVSKDRQLSQAARGACGKRLLSLRYDKQRRRRKSRVGDARGRRGLRHVRCQTRSLRFERLQKRSDVSSIVIAGHSEGG